MLSDMASMLVVVDRVEYGELAFGLDFKDEREASGEEYGDEYADRLEEYSRAVA